MLGRSLTRYHTSSMQGQGLTRKLVKLAGPSLVKSIGHGLQSYEKGASLQDALSSSRQMFKKGLKLNYQLPRAPLLKQQ